MYRRSRNFTTHAYELVGKTHEYRKELNKKIAIATFERSADFFCSYKSAVQ